MISKFSDIVRRIVDSAQSCVYLLISIIFYIAYFEALTAYLQEYIGRGFIIIALVLTFAYRLDILPAVAGFWAMWTIWHAPLWLSIILLVCFLLLSALANEWPNKKFIAALKRIIPSKRKES